ncbi:MAG: hypothetical protein HF962_00465 [Sulfurovum sp.]|nr:hypothetical protein [Sulfurovum sp.]
MRQIIISVMIVCLLILTGCGSTVLSAALTPVKIKISNPVLCGKITTTRRAESIYITKKDYRCMQRQLRTCLYDRKRLIIANDAMVRQIEIAGENHGE